MVALKKRAVKKAAARNSTRAATRPVRKKAVKKKARSGTKPKKVDLSGKRRQKTPVADEPDPQLLFDAAKLVADAEKYERHKERTRKRQASISGAGREIGPLPDVVDPARKEACRHNFRLFCESYFPDIFFLGWSPEQLLVIQRIERCVLHGGLFAVAMPRGNGKSCLCEAAVLWAVLYGHHHYVMLICSTFEKYRDEALDSMKTALESNELLLEDFPEVCYPIQCLEGIAQKAKGQTLNGERTAIQWSGRRLILPTVAGSPASGAIIGGGGLGAGTIRGSKFRTRDNKVHRPSLVILDDPQTDESAESATQSAKRERLISSAVLGMAGPGQKISVIMPCTVIQRGDMADRMLDREKHPEWKGHRTAMIIRWPTRMDLWEEWDELRRKVLRKDDDLNSDEDDPAPEATDFLKKIYAEAHTDGAVSWDARKLPYHVSALHQAMEFYFRDPVGFFSEYQNWLMTPGSPSDPTTSEDLHLDASVINSKYSGYAPGVLPPDTQWVTGFIDCHDRVLMWMLCSWAPDFTGTILAYGSWPETSRLTYYVGSFRPTLKEKHPGTGQDGALTAGLDALANVMLEKQFSRKDSLKLSAEKILIDTGYMGGTIKKWIDSRNDQRLLPSVGRQIGPNQMPFAQWKPRAGELHGDGWLVRKPYRGQYRGRHCLIDTYAWKDFAARRLLTAIGDPGCVSLVGSKAHRGLNHEFLARQLAAEQARQLEGDTKVNAWDKRPGETENHWWDGFVGNCVAASMLGARIGGKDAVPTPVAPRARARVRATPLPDGRSFFITRR